MPHLFIAVTAHGYGHLAQVGPVAQALSDAVPELRITLQGPIAPAFAAARLPRGFRHLETPADVALPMAGPLQVRWEEGLARYSDFDTDHAHRVARQQALLAADPPDLLIADIPWVPLIAARHLGIPSVALCSLNWLDILAQSPVGGRLPASLVAHLHEGYASADLFLRPAPSMPMAWLPNARDIGPIAACRPRRPAAIRARLGIPDEKRLVLMQFGGTGRLRLDEETPLPASVHILTPDRAAAAGRPDISAIGGPGLDVLDVLASCDAVITKPGYGTFAEAACNGIPVLYVPRRDWPEEPPLVEWLTARVPTRAIEPTELAAGRIAAPLEAILAAGPTTPVPATGIGEAVDLLRRWLQ
ncbi:hypothetical protein [Thioflavicoccus mobilis]|nr:hypothetical protein [Thioflavicoccus mobilis]